MKYIPKLMIKKKIKRISSVALLTVMIGFFSCNDAKKKEENAVETKRPNIIFLLADDERNNTLKALGNAEVITPNLDKLVEGGTTFSNGYIMGAMNGAVCSPSRAMLMTGRTLFNIDPTGNSIDPAHTTMPKALENAGYHTFHIGKWHNGRPAFINSFTDGSKIFFGGMHSQYNVPTYEYDAGGDYSEAKMNTPSEKHSSELYADAGVEFLNTYDDEKPFFMYLAFQAPHDPRQMPKEYLDMYDTTNISLPKNFMPEHPFDNGEIDIRDEWLAGYPRTRPEIKANIAAYYAMITHLDAQIGRVFKALEDKGMMENTIIVFSGDNGLAVGQHGLMGKQNLYEHSVNVPLVFKGPGIPKGKTNDNFAYLFDIYPTLVDIAGIDVPETVMGQSLLPSIKDPSIKTRENMFFAYKNFQRAARNGNWKIIKYNVGDKITTQLFDLEKDALEMDNLADNSDYSKELERMTKILEEQMAANNDAATLGEKGWGVPVLKAWKEKASPEEVAELRELAEKEREMRGFGGKK